MTARTLVAAVALGAAVLMVVPAGAAGPAPAPTVGAPQGNVQPALQPVKGVGVAATGAAVDDQVPVIIQNGGTKTARVDLVSATATSSDGSSVTRARSVETFPEVLAPGELALAAVKFRKNGVPPGATVLVKVRSTSVGAAKASRALAVSDLVLSPPQTGRVAQVLNGTVTNPTNSWTARSPKVAVMCFGEARQPATLTTARARGTRVAPGKQTTVSVPMTTLCPTYLVAARAT